MELLDLTIVKCEFIFERALNSEEFRTTYAITGPNHGKSYIEFLVPDDLIVTQKNPRTGN